MVIINSFQSTEKLVFALFFSLEAEVTFFSVNERLLLNICLVFFWLDSTHWLLREAFSPLTFSTKAHIQSHMKKVQHMIIWPVTITDTDLLLNAFFPPSAPTSMPRREIPAHFHPITASFLAAPLVCDKRNLWPQESFTCSYVAIPQKSHETTGFCCL